MTRPCAAFQQCCAHDARRVDGPVDGRVDGLWGDRRAWAGFAVAVAIILFARFAWSVPSGVIAQGALVGGLTSLLALGIALVYRANRIVNFAAGDLGLVPATFAILLMIGSARFGWWPALFVGVVTAVALGALVEVGIIRRFSRAPRLILTVATIGLAQLLAAASLKLPAWIVPTSRAVPEPFDVHLTISPITFKGTDVVAFVVVPLAFVALAVFLRATDAGIAIRAGADATERAAGLGIPVRSLQTLVWVIASVLAFVAVFLRAGIVGLPLGEVLGPAILLRALAAAVVGRMERLPTIAGAAIVLGIVEQAVIWHWNEPDYVDPVLFVVVVGALLLTRGGLGAGSRAGEVSSWQAAREVRPVPRELRGLPEVRAAKWGIAALAVAVLLLAPAFLSESKTNLAAAILIFGIIAISFVVLTGWAGEVSLGQMALVGIGAAVAGSLTARAGWDLALALVAGGLVGAIVAVLIGLPAIGRRGLTFAVISLAFALMTSSWLLNQSFFGAGSTLDWLPPLHIARPTIFGSIAVDTETRFYYLCVAGLGLAYAIGAWSASQPSRARDDRGARERPRRGGVRHQLAQRFADRVRVLRLPGRVRGCALRPPPDRARLGTVRARGEPQGLLDGGDRRPRLDPGGGPRRDLRARGRLLLPRP